MKQEIESVEEVDLPDGSYLGKMGGYQIVLKMQEKEVRFKTNIGIRSTNAPCLVGVKDKKAKVLI